MFSRTKSSTSSTLICRKISNNKSRLSSMPR